MDEKDILNEENTEAKPQSEEKISLLDRVKAGAGDAKDWLMDKGNVAKDTAGDAVKWVEENAPIAMEKAGEAAEKARVMAEGAADWADASAKKAKAWMDSQAAAKRFRDAQYELDTLRPVFEGDVPMDYSLYPVLNIVESDEKRSKSKVCEGSIGFRSEAKGVEVLNVYIASFDCFPVKLDGGLETGVYYANPYKPGEYIESSKYATYLKKERVRELINIADCLGAKRVSVTFGTSEKKSEEQKGKVGFKNGKNKAEAELERKISDSLNLSIVHATSLKPHDNPVMPELVYYKYDKTIRDLIDRRMRKVLVSDTYSVTYAEVSDAKIKEATKIDGAVHALKLGTQQSLSACLKVEKSIRTSYTIEFED